MRESVVTMIASQRAGLLVALAHVDGSSWDLPTPCEGWSVRDVLAHLVEGELAIGSVYRGEVREQGFVDLTRLDRWSPLPAEAVRSAFWQHSESSARLLAAMDEERWAAPIRAFGCRRMSQLVRLHLFEGVVHGLDLTIPLGLPDVHDTEALAFAVTHALRAAPGALARHGVEPVGTLTFETPERSVRLAPADGAWGLLEEPGTSDARIALDDRTLLLALTGRADVTDEAISGEPDIARAVLPGLVVTR